MDMIREDQFHGLQKFDFSVSLGAGVINRWLGVLIKPVYFFALFWPIDKIEYLIDLDVISGLFFSGFTFLLYYIKSDEDNNPNIGIVGGIVYAFSGYAIYAMKHPGFLDMMALFPLFLLSIDKAIKENNKKILSLLVFYTAMLEIYNLYIITFALSVFALIKIIDSSRNCGLKAGIMSVISIIESYTVGVCMSAFVWLPKMLDTYIPSGRIGGANSAVYQLWRYDSSYYSDFLRSLFVGKATLSYWMVLGFPITLLISIIMILIKQEKGEYWKIVFLLAYIAMALVPLFGFIASGFSGISNRWSFAIAFASSLIISSAIDKIRCFSSKQVGILCGLVCISVTAYCAILRFGIGIQECINIFFLLVVLSGLYLFTNNRINKTVIQTVLVIITTLSLYSNTLYVFVLGDSYVGTFFNSGTAWDLYTDSSLLGISAWLKEHPDDEFYRVGANDIWLSSISSAKVLDLYSISGFSSADSAYNDYLMENSASGFYDSACRLGMDNRTMMLALANVKYYAVSQNSRALLPYGYVELMEFTNGHNTKSDVAVNSIFLPFGYTYDSYIMRDDYDMLPDINKQEALIQSVLLEDSRYTGSLRANSNVYNAYPIEDVAYSETELGSDNGNIQVSFETPSTNSEVYLRIKNYDSLQSVWWITVKNLGEVFTRSFFTDENNTYSTYTDERLINLGCYPGSSKNTYEIDFPNKDQFLWDTLEVWAIPLDTYAYYISRLSEEHLEDVIIVDNSISGSVKVSCDKILCFSIPVSTINGWKAYVDGQETELFRANSLYMGIYVPEGEHAVYLEYKRPYGTVSLFVSLFGMLWFAIIIYRNSKKSHSLWASNFISKNDRHLCKYIDENDEL